MPQFSRVCRVTVGPAGGEGVSVDERFRIAFRVTKTVSRETNAVTVQIHGLREETRNRIRREAEVCQIEAGYGDQREVLAIADVTRIVARREGTEVITEIECADGARELIDRRVHLSFAGGTTAQRVLDRLSSELALGERATGVQVDGFYQQGVSFSGRIAEVLDKVTGRAGVTWSIQNGDLQILDRVDAAQGRGVVLSPATGLLDSPEALTDEESITERRRGQGYRMRCQLQPAIRPGERVIVQSADVDEVLRVDMVEHTGDTRGPDWISEVEAYAEP